MDTNYPSGIRHKRVLSILRAKDVLARTRKAQSNRWHTLLAAALVVAYEDQHDLYVSTRRAAKSYIVLE